MNLYFYFILCILIRFLLSFLVYCVYNNNFRYILIIFYLISASGLFYNYFTKIRKIGAFNNKIWWDSLRPLHAVLFISTAFLLIMKNKYSYILPLIDTIIGIIFFLINHKLV